MARGRDSFGPLAGYARTVASGNCHYYPPSSRVAVFESVPYSGAVEGWFPEEECSRTVLDDPDSNSALHIITYPFCYNPLTTDIRFYRDYSFDISCTVSPVALASLTNDKDAYEQGDIVVVDVRLNNSGEVQDVVVSTLMKRYGRDDVLPAADIALP